MPRQVDRRGESDEPLVEGEPSVLARRQIGTAEPDAPTRREPEPRPAELWEEAERLREEVRVLRGQLDQEPAASQGEPAPDDLDEEEAEAEAADPRPGAGRGAVADPGAPAEALEERLARQTSAHADALIAAAERAAAEMRRAAEHEATMMRRSIEQELATLREVQARSERLRRSLRTTLEAEAQQLERRISSLRESARALDGELGELGEHLGEVGPAPGG